jgi:hypothetical protein
LKGDGSFLAAGSQALEYRGGLRADPISGVRIEAHTNLLPQKIEDKHKTNSNLT